MSDLSGDGAGGPGGGRPLPPRIAPLARLARLAKRAQLDRGVFFRFLLSVLLAGAAFALFVVSRGGLGPRPEGREQSVAAAAGRIGAGVDSVLARYGIERAWITERRVPIPNSQLARRERRILLPLDVPAVQLNVALNAMARSCGGRAVASENPKEGTVTIHLELGGIIVETLIVRPEKNIHRRREGGGASTAAPPPGRRPPFGTTA